MNSSHWLIYALGGGLGHLARSLALARAAAKQNHRVTLFSNSPFAKAIEKAAAEFSGCEFELLAPSSTPSDSAARLAGILGQDNFDALIVDTFPRGIGGELPPILKSYRGKKILVHRDITPDYVEQARLREFTADHFDMLLLPGEVAPLQDHARSVRTPPWLLCDREELAGFAEARAALRASGVPAPVVLVAGCGRKEEIAASAALARRLSEELGDLACVRFTAPMHWQQTTAASATQCLWPILKYMRGIDILVGAGGYNTVQEARATATPLVAFARSRLYDRQALRLRAEEKVQDDSQAVRRVREILSRLPSEPRKIPEYVNGTHEAVCRIWSAGVPPAPPRSGGARDARAP